MSTTPRSLRTRLVWSTALATGGIVAASTLVSTLPSHAGGDPADLKAAYEQAAEHAEAPGEPSPDEPEGHAHGDEGHDDGHGHDHSDPATKNAVSRGVDGSVDPTTMDPTTPRQARRGIATVEAQRAEPDPRLVPAPAAPARATTPTDRYELAGGCYVIQAPSGNWVARFENAYRDGAGTHLSAEPFRFKATDLGRYLLFDTDKGHLSAQGTAVVASATAGPAGDWTVRRRDGRFFLTQGDTGLRLDGRSLTTGDPQGFRLRLSDGCAKFPEVSVNIGGRPYAGTTPFQEVRGTIDAHTHGMAFEFLGGGAHCGRPWSPYGVTAALVDCPDHSGNGVGAALENLTRTGSPVGTHDPVGWPTFKDWPAPDSLTHEGTYYKWMERAWRGGLRLFVNLLVENNQLCTIYPIKKNSCDDMDSIRLQAQRMREFERYIDAQSGGPGKGWYRIVTDPFEAREVINEGKLAVIMGIETSVPFGCSTVVDVPECTAEEVVRQLDEVHKMGVRQMELVNKFDNAFSGVAGDGGEIGVLVNGANFLETQSFWDMRSCPTDFGDGVSDKPQYAAPQDGGAFGQRDGFFGAVAEVSGVRLPSLPLYAPAPHCNERGLTELGATLIKELAKRGMVFDPDHMSVKARKASLDLLEKLDYPGVISSHSWSTPDAYPRIYRLGGAVFPYAGDSAGFVEKWKRHLTWADPRYYFGFGYGADINGLGAQGDPRGADAKNKVTYPFTGLGGVKVSKQVSGERVYDINVDGVAHYGLYPDWLEDLRRQAGNDIMTDMSRGAEAYLQMWERALGVTNDACREPAVARKVALFKGLDRGLTVKQVLLRAGQPHSRLDDTLTYCAKDGSGDLTRVRLTFDDRGRLR